MIPPAIKLLGASVIPRRDYLQRLATAKKMKCSF